MPRASRLVVPGLPHHVTQRGVRGYLFQGRFWSSVLDEPHLLASVRYTELNPVAAGIVERPEAYEWSSAAFHLGIERADPLVVDRTLLELVDSWETSLQDGMDEIEARELEKRPSTGRPLGSAAFVEGLEKRYGRRLTAGRPGRPRKRRA